MKRRINHAVAARFTWPRQTRGRYLCLADFFRDRAEAAEHGPDVLPMQLVTMGSAVSRATAELFARDAYRDYLELHGLSVQLTEALAEFWHHRVRTELGLAGDDGDVARVYGDMLATAQAAGEVRAVDGIGDRAFETDSAAPTVRWVQGGNVYGLSILLPPSAGRSDPAATALQLARLASSRIEG